jgi:isopentenyl diphosphate isomerase/L-lactate dehydrogenase-like FMN-dependent dehydrogenase
VNVESYRRLASQTLSARAFESFEGGVDDGDTVLENRDGFQRIKLVQKVMRDVTTCAIETSILDTTLSMPVILAPISHHQVAHPQGELATARAATTAGTIMILSTGSSYSLEEVRESASGTLWFQLFVLVDDGVTRDLISRAESSAYSALVLTVDAQVLGNHELGRASQLVTRQGNLERYEIDRSSGQLLSPAVTWQSLEWIREHTTLPIVLKGIQTGEDARKAVAAGCDALYVSNHGGRQLDSLPSTIEMLEEVSQSVGDDVELLVDGGFRRGTDVLKAMALGARAVGVGRPYLYGLAADGETGAAGVLEVFREEIERDMRLMGCVSLGELDRSWVRFSPNFTR